jgi:hypothetical protein
MPKPRYLPALLFFAIAVAPVSGDANSKPDQFTPLASVLNNNVRPFLGTDGRLHIVYELVLTDASLTPATLETIEVMGASNSSSPLATYSDQSRSGASRGPGEHSEAIFVFDKIPPLRDRRQDIPLLAGYFLERLSRSSGQERHLCDDTMKALLAYDWPGNVRELENCLERACAFTSGPMIQVGDLPSAIHGASSHISTDGNGKAQILPMAQLEKQTILSAIAQLNGDKLLAARMLGIGKTTLYRKRKEYVVQD